MVDQRCYPILLSIILSLVRKNVMNLKRCLNKPRVYGHLLVIVLVVVKNKDKYDFVNQSFLSMA